MSSTVSSHTDEENGTLGRGSTDGPKATFSVSVSSTLPYSASASTEDLEKSHEATHTLTDWDSPDDPGNPRNWGFGERVYGVLVPAWYAFAVTCGTSIYAPGVFDIEAKFGVSQTVAILGLTLYAVGLGFGPVLGAPISETLGRRWVYWISMPIMILFIIGAAEAKNIGTILVCRLFSSLFGAPALAVGAGSVADIWDLQQGGGIAGMFFVLVPFLGSSIGPLVGGYTVQERGEWQWTMWVLIMIAGPAWISSFFLRETSQKIILRKRALQRGMPAPPKPPPKEALKMLLTVTLLRPIHMLFCEPIIGWASLYLAFAFGILFAFFDAMPYVFVKFHHFTLGQSGLPFIGILVGIIIGAIIFAIVDKTLYAKAKARVTEPGKIPPPEERMYSSMIGSCMLPVALFWFAWTARSDIHWIVPIIAGIPFGCGLVLLFLGISIYLVDAYQALNAASAIAANSLLRYVFAGMFPLFTVQMFDKLGVDWACSLLGFISLGMLPIPWIMYKWGPFLRRRSAYKMGNF